MSSSSSTTALIEIEDLKVYGGSNHTLFRGKKVEFGNSTEKRVDSESGSATGTGKCVSSESKSGSATGTGKCVGSESKSATGNSSPLSTSTTAPAPRDIHIDSTAQQPDDDEAAKPAVAVDQPFFNDDPMDI